MGVYWLAICVVLTTEFAVSDDKRISAEKAIAIQEPMPAAVDLSDFDKDADVHLLNEVHVTGWINSAYNIHLIKTKNGTTRSERYMMVLFGNEDTADTKVAKAAMLLTKAQRERFIADKDDRFQFDMGPSGLALSLNGRGESSVTLSSMAKSALKDYGLSRSKNFVFLEPYWSGREAAFAPQPLKTEGIRQFGYGLTAVLAFIGLFKYWRRQARAITPHGMPGGINNPDYLAASPIQSMDKRSRDPFAQPAMQKPTMTTAMPKVAPAAKKPSGRKRMPNWAIGLIIVVVAFQVLPSGYGAVIPILLFWGGMLFIAKKGLDGVGLMFNTSQKAVSSMLSNGNGPAARKKRPESPFDRLR